MTRRRSVSETLSGETLVWRIGRAPRAAPAVAALAMVLLHATSPALAGRAVVKWGKEGSLYWSCRNVVCGDQVSDSECKRLCDDWCALPRPCSCVPGKFDPTTSCDPKDEPELFLPD